MLRSILLVDDEPDIRTIGAMSLQRVGKLEVRTASSGPEALALVAESVPDAILLDVMMPGMDGPATLRELRAIPALAHTPVLFMTAKVLRDEIDRWLSLGALGVIHKPFDPMTLPNEVRALVEPALAAKQ